MYLVSVHVHVHVCRISVQCSLIFKKIFTACFACKYACTCTSVHVLSRVDDGEVFPIIAILVVLKE